MQMKLLWITNVDFGVTDQRLIKFLYGAVTRENWEFNGTVHQLFIDFEKAYDSVRKEVLYNILILFGITRKQVEPIEICLNEI
jgi:hypothetical protein